jgi:hypothetical protein
LNQQIHQKNQKQMLVKSVNLIFVFAFLGELCVLRGKKVLFAGF